MLRIVKVSKISPGGEIVDPRKGTHNLGLFLSYDSAKKFFEYCKRQPMGSYALFMQKKNQERWIDIESWSNVEV